MNRVRTGILKVTAVCSCVLILAPPCGADEVTVSRIAQVWAEREKRVKSCRVVWEQKETYPKGSYLINIEAQPSDLPTADLTIPGTSTMILDGHKSRHEYRGQMWSTKTRTLEPAAYIMTFDGARAADTSLQSPFIGNPQVTLKKATASPQGGLPRFLPIWLTVRASIAAKEIPIEQFTPTGRTERIDNRPCPEFARGISGAVRERLWIDPERGCQVTRYGYYRDDKLNIKLEISYRPDPTLGWVPAAWDLVLCTQAGAIASSTRCVVTEFVTNIETAASDFEPVLPVGARVIDLTTGKEMHSGILPGGERGREIEYVTGKGSPPYETLMAQPPQRGWWQQTGLWIITGVGLLAVVGVAVWRVRVRGKPPAQPS